MLCCCEQHFHSPVVVLPDAGTRVETHVHLAGTAPYSFLSQNAQSVDEECGEQHLPRNLLEAIDRVVHRLKPERFSPTYFSHGGPTSLYGLSEHTALKTALAEFSNVGQQVDPNSTYADFARFSANFSLQDAYLDKGGRAYLVSLLKNNSAILYADNVLQVEYSFGIKPAMASMLLSAVKEVEAEYPVKIRFLASFRVKIKVRA